MQKEILIIEDNIKWLENIKEAVNSVSGEIKVFAEDKLAEAYQIAMERNIDLFIIDIILNPGITGDVSGMKFAENLRQNEKYRFTPIIFVTSLEDPKLLAYANIHCYGYIEKPFKKEEAAKIIEEALSIPLKKENRKEYVYFRKEGILYGLRKEDIVYIESSAHGTIICSVFETIKIPYWTIKNLLIELNSCAFIQCNRNTIINKKYIEYIDSTNRYVKLRNINLRIEIGIIMKNRFLQEIENG